MGDNDINIEGDVFRAEKLKAGDCVILCLSRDDYEPENLKTMMETLRERFPEVEFTLVAGVTGVVVHRAAD